jgi:RNA-directed DNA polymerase
VKIIRRMLKSEILYNNEYQIPETGTPQGGVLSPMLANVALTALDNYCEQNFGYTYGTSEGKRRYNPIVR